MLKFLTIVLLATSAIVGVARAVEFSDAIEGSPIPNPPYISTDVIPLIRGGVTYRLPVTSIAGSGGMALDANNATLPDARNNLGLGTASNVGFNSLTLTSPLVGQYGGTGVANTGKTITLGGNLVTGGAFATTLTATATTSLTLPTTGTLATLGGPETFTNKTLTAPTMTAPVLGAASATSITGLSAPVNDSDAVNKAYVNAIAAGIFFHDEVKAASTANLSATYANGASGVGATLTNSGAQVAFASDGYSGLTNDRFLIKDQTLTQHNGVYTLTTVGTGATNWVLTRATDFDANGGGEVTTGAALTVLNGTALANSFWVETGQGAFTIGTTPIIFSRITTGAGGTVNSGTINQFGVYAAAGTTLSGQSFTGLMKGNGASAPGVYAGTSCTNQFPRSLDLNGAATCATVGSSDLASALVLTGPIMTAPVLGTPASGVGTNITGIPIVGGTTGTLTVARGGTGLTAGTSGGIPAYTASGTLASSGALTAGMPVVGGGAGVAPTVGTRSGNTTAYVTTTGTQTLGRCVVIDANGNHVADTGACGVIETVTTGISAAGTTQGTATLLSSVQNYVSTVAAGTGVRLQTGAAGGREYIINEGANELLIYPATGVTINSLSANIPVSLAVNTTVQLIAKSATAWRTVP